MAFCMAFRASGVAVCKARTGVLSAALVLATAGLTFAQAAPAAAPDAGKTAPAPAAPAADMPSAQSLIEKAIQASGGREAIAGVKNRVITARLSIPAQNLSGTVRSVSAAPNLNRTTMEIEGLGKIEQGFDGTTAWTNSGMQGPSIMEGPEKESFLRASDMFSELNVEKLYNATTKGKETVNGLEAWRVELTDKADPKRKPVQHFYDADSGRLIKRIEAMVTPMGEISSTYLFESYKKFGPILVPTVTKQSAMGVDNVVTVETIEFPETMDASTFALPAEVKELAEKKAAKPAGDAPAEKPAADKPAEKPSEKPATP